MNNIGDRRAKFHARFLPPPPVPDLSIVRAELSKMSQSLAEDRENQLLKVPPLLYHYTTEGGFDGILSSSRLRATHYSYLKGDSEEIIYGDSLVKEVVSTIMETEQDPVCKTLLSLPSKQFSNVFTVFMDAYIACLCEGANQDSQWATFTRDEGRCIGFSTDGCAHNLAGIDGPPRAVLTEEQQFYLLPVDYDRDSQVQKISNIVNSIISVLKSNIPITHNQNHNSLVGECFSTFVREMNILLPSFKPSSYKDELEWRLMRVLMKRDPQTSFRTDADGVKIPFVLIDLAHWKSGSKLLPVHDVKFKTVNKLSDSVIRSITKSLSCAGYGNSVKISAA